MQWTHQPVRRIKPRLSVRGSRGVPGPRLRVILSSPPLAYRPPPPSMPTVPSAGFLLR